MDIFNSNPSNFILTHINVGCLLKSLLGETIDKTYRKSDIEKFVYWVIQMQSRSEEFNRIIHNLGGPVRSSGNNQTQAFLFSLFILPAQEKLMTAAGVKFQRSELYQAGQMMIEVLSKEATDVGQRFKSEKDRLERTITDECSKENDDSGFSTEIEVFYLDEHERDGYGFEFITPILKDIHSAFRIPKAFVELN